MSIVTILLFFVYTYGLGFTVTCFLKNLDNFFERSLTRIGIGLAVIPLVGIILNLLHIPIDWKILLFLSLIMPLYSVYKSRKNLKAPIFRLTKSNINIILVLLMFSLTLFMYARGSFTYPYLEDEDPWTHAASTKYVALEKNLRDPTNVFRYIDPYPPGFAILFGILHQTSPSLTWTMKFFNALIISLGIIFFYLFSKEFIRNRNKALFSTAVFAMIPCYLSHFIWAHSYIVTLFFPLMYCFLMIDKEPKWKYVSAVVFSGLLLIQPTQPIKLSIMLLLYIAILSILRKKIQWNKLFAFFTGILLSLLWWYNKITSMLKMKGEKKSVFNIEETNFLTKIIAKLSKAFPNTSGTATRAYTFSDYFFAKSKNLINNPVGVGIVLSILLFITLIFILIRYKSLVKKENHWILITLSWLLFTFIGMNSLTFNLPVGLFAFRFWMLFAIPVSLLVCEGAWFLAYLFKQLRIPFIITFVLILIGVFFTSGIQKYKVNTSMWGPGQIWTSMEELQAFLWLNNLPAGEPVFSYANGEAVLALDKYMCTWCQETVDFKTNFLNTTIEEKYNWLKKHNYKYFIIGGADFRDLAYYYGENKSNPVLNNILVNSSEYFGIAHQTNGAVIFKIL